eukprot:366538-Chlamydomonas_euryale.AAC.1
MRVWMKLGGRRQAAHPTWYVDGVRTRDAIRARKGRPEHTQQRDFCVLLRLRVGASVAVCACPGPPPPRAAAPCGRD